MANKQTLPLNLILLGDPAAGKATHAKYLCEAFNMYDLDMGKELRNIKYRKSNIKNILANTLDKGKLTPTDIVRKILYEKIHSTPKNKGILFDGTPKMIGEAKLVTKWLKAEGRSNPLVIYMSIPMAETIKRMTQRKEDFKGKFSKRADDDKKALENRVKYYRENISEVVKYFKTIYSYKKISSNAPVPRVRKVLVKIIENNASKV
ncbi:MAG: nucleoside monophosphate kinase [Candidatus Doudnabacteria bacterium]|nr:nucleoside monophosphate kinase [Candidatus Doudnabacteria bacterium]